MFLSHSSAPSKGILQISVGSETTNVCGEGLKKTDADVVCRHLGYQKAYSLMSIPNPMDVKAATISRLYCSGNHIKLSQCKVTIADSKSCLQLSYIECKYGWIKQPYQTCFVRRHFDFETQHSGHLPFQDSKTHSGSVLHPHGVA
jgi:hypothetical protein